MKKNVLIWTLAIVVTLASAIYQRLTGPTHPLKTTIKYHNKNYPQKFLRSHGGKGDAKIELELPSDENLSVKIVYKLYPGNYEWVSKEMKFSENKWIATLPHQPAAGKYQYYFKILDGNTPIYYNNDSPIIIRFKGAVPSWVLIIHILFMFSAMLFANTSGFMAIFKDPRHKIYARITFILLLIGGMIMGPIVQKFAFGEFWTGIPKGWDLTDNKTLIAFIAWIIAISLNWKKNRPAWTIFAAFVTLLIFAIPHSMFGSTLNHETGNVTQGFVFIPLILYFKDKSIFKIKKI